MQFDLRQLGRHGGDEHLDRTYQPAQFDAPVVKDEEYEVVAPVHLVLDVHRNRDAYRVTGRVETRLRLECGRCLEPFEEFVGTTFEESALDIYVVGPSSEMWAEGDRGILCTATRVDGLQLDSSVRASGI